MSIGLMADNVELGYVGLDVLVWQAVYTHPSAQHIRQKASVSVHLARAPQHGVVKMLHARVTSNIESFR